MLVEASVENGIHGVAGEVVEGTGEVITVEDPAHEGVGTGWLIVIQGVLGGGGGSQTGRKRSCAVPVAAGVGGLPPGSCWRGGRRAWVGGVGGLRVGLVGRGWAARLGDPCRDGAGGPRG